MSLNVHQYCLYPFRVSFFGLRYKQKLGQWLHERLFSSAERKDQLYVLFKLKAIMVKKLNKYKNMSFNKIREHYKKLQCNFFGTSASNISLGLPLVGQTGLVHSQHCLSQYYVTSDTLRHLKTITLEFIMLPIVLWKLHHLHFKQTNVDRQYIC